MLVLFAAVLHRAHYPTDYDPLILAHARALLVSDTTTGSSEVLDADLRQPAQLVTNARLDHTTPVAVILSHVLGELTDPGEARRVLTELMEAVAPGSYLLLCEPTNTSPASPRATHTHLGAGAQPYRLCSPDHLAELVQDLELVSPGLVAVDRWRPGHLDITHPSPCDAYGVLARAPRRVTPPVAARRIPVRDCQNNRGAPRGNDSSGWRWET